MGCDVSALSRHNLDITNVETLAHDLANRLGFTIDFGYYSRAEYNKLLENGLEENYISLGLIDKQPFKGKFRLVDEKYQEKQLHEKFGEALFDMTAFYWWLDSTETVSAEKKEDEKKNLTTAEFFLETFEEEGDYQHLYVYNSIISNDLYYYTRWWDFCTTVQTKEYFYKEYFQDFRSKIMTTTLALGGDKVYYVNDQSDFLEGVGQGSEENFTWEALERHIAAKLEDCLISISKSVLDNNYQNEIEQLPLRKIAFYDDFKDLTTKN